MHLVHSTLLLSIIVFGMRFHHILTSMTRFILQMLLLLLMLIRITIRTLLLFLQFLMRLCHLMHGMMLTTVMCIIRLSLLRSHHLSLLLSLLLYILRRRLIIFHLMRHWLLSISSVAIIRWRWRYVLLMIAMSIHIMQWLHLLTTIRIPSMFLLLFTRNIIRITACTNLCRFYHPIVSTIIYIAFLLKQTRKQIP